MIRAPILGRLGLGASILESKHRDARVDIVGPRFGMLGEVQCRVGFGAAVGSGMW